jgi:hypothetical protein
MTNEEAAMLAEVRTDIKWLVQAHKDDAIEHDGMEKRIGSLERSRSRAKGAGTVLASVSAAGLGIWKFLLGG